jgi:methyltransferase (TIGR00027 family)
MDFNREDLKTVLETHGYVTDRRTFFVWEAVTQYLPEDAVRSTFQFLSHAARGSRLAFTYIRQDFIQGQVMYEWEKGYEEYVETDIWKFGLDPEALSDFLGEHGWRLIEDVGYDELDERYVKRTGRVFVPTLIERVAYAEKA